MKDKDVKKRTNPTSSETPKPGLAVSLAIVLFLVICFVIQVVQTGNPDVHMTLIFATVFAVVLLMFKGVKLSLIEEGVIHGCKTATVSMMILMFIGVMIPAWIAAGTIPTLIYYGLQILSPSIFLFATILICSVSSLCTGTSWGTAATFGVALVGIGGGLGVPLPMTAGCIVVGALFGDKLSPISDTVNLSAGACEVNIFEHIKSVATTTLPAYVVSLVCAIIWGLKFRGGMIDDSQINGILTTISDNFNVSPGYALASLIPLIFILTASIKKVNSLATIVAASMIGMILAVLLQGYSITEMMSYMNYGFVIDTGNFDVDKLMNRGGLQSMMWTVSIGYLGLSYGGILEKTGVMETLLYSIKVITKNARNLIVSQTIAGFATIMLSASPYVAILIPGRMFAPAYSRIGIKKIVASRTCETSGICLDPLLPWTLGGVYYAGVLGVSPLEYGPFAVMLWLVPIISIVYAFTGWFVWKEDPETIAALEAEAAD